MMTKVPHTIRRLAIACALCFFTLFAHGQLSKDVWSITGELSLPSGRSNPAFRNYLNGLINVHPKIAYKPVEHWYVALGPKYMYYTISEYKVPQKINGGMHVVGGDLEVGWTKWQGPHFGIEFGVKTGVVSQLFVTDITRETGIQRVNCIYTEPTLSLILLADEAVAYRWIVGYNISGYHFKPYHLGFDTMDGYTDSDLNKPAQSLLVGFGMTYYFGNKRSDVFIDDGL